MSLRAILATVMTAMGLSALAAAVGLITMAAYMHETVTTVTTNVESVHTAEEMEVDLLVHNRLAEPLARAQLEGQLRGWLLEIRSYVSSAEEERLFQTVARTMNEYLADHQRATSAGLGFEKLVRETAPELEAAFLALEALVHLNVRQTRATAAQVEHWDRNAMYLGAGVALMLVVTVSAVLVWLRFFAFRSVLDLEAVMRRFAQGDKGARVAASGPRELRDIGARFNEMAVALERQYDNRLAFLGGVVHDLRNPLSVLKLSTTQLGAERVAQAPQRSEKALAMVKRQVERLERMLEDLLDAARVEAGHLELRLSRRDLRDISREVVETFRERSANHELRLRLPEQPLLVSCDPLRIEQVLTNLVSNAIKYSPRGGRVDVVLDQPGSDAVVKVVDQGVGISPEDQASIFEPFQRSGASRELAPGAGLGLFVTRRIVEAHGGRIEVESRPGVGSTFCVHLPLSAVSKAA